MSGCTVRRWAHTSRAFSKYIEVVISVLLLGDRWPLKPAVIATYWSGICDQYCLYRESFKYKLRRISVCGDKSPAWQRSTSTQPRRFLLPESYDGKWRGDRDGGLSPAWPRALSSHGFAGKTPLPKITLPSSIPLRFLKRFDRRMTFTARPAGGLTWAAVLEPGQRLRGRMGPAVISRERRWCLPAVPLTQRLPRAKTPWLLYFPDHRGQLASRAKPARMLPSGNIPFYFRNWTTGIN